MSKADEYCKRENIAENANRDKREAIKSYLEKKCEEDSALAEKYKAELMDKCLSFIEDVASNYLGGKSGQIDDSVVYKWARDYFIDGYAEQEEKEAAERKAKAEENKNKAAKNKAVVAKEKAKPEETEEPEDEDDEAESEESGDVLGSDAETKPAIVSKKPKTAQPEQRSLFDFGDDDA